MELCQLDSLYLHDLGEYNKVLMQRNKLLKQIYYQPSLKDTLDIWDMNLMEYGKKIIHRREDFVKEISSIVTRVNEQLTGSKEHIKIFYEPDTTIDEFEEKLKIPRKGFKNVFYKCRAAQG